MTAFASPEADSQQLFISLLQTAGFPEAKQEQMIQQYEAAVYARTLKTLLALLPDAQRRKLETTMHFQPDRFLSRILAILQAFATTEQIVDVMDKTSEETFLEFFDTFLSHCDEEQKHKVDAYISQLGDVVTTRPQGIGF